MVMAKEEKKMCIVSQKQINEVVERGLNLVRTSFKVETEPIFFAYKAPTNGINISKYLKEKLPVFRKISNLTWFEYNKKADKNERVMGILKKLGVAICLFLSINVMAQKRVTIDQLIYELHDTDASVYGYEGSLTKVIIPETIKYMGQTYPVTSIGDYAFHYCSELKSVSISNSVISIGAGAFGFCTNLTSLFIPKSVTNIGKSNVNSPCFEFLENPFGGCSNLLSIYVDDGNSVYDSRDNCNAIIETATNKLTTGCMNTVIPNTVTTIGDEAFCECSGLTNINIPCSVTTIGAGAFYGCTSLVTIDIPFSVTNIGKDGISWEKDCLRPDSFCGYISMSDEYLGGAAENVTGYGAFENCTSLKSVLIPSSVTTLGMGTFCGCTSLSSVDIPSSVSCIDIGCFSGCVNLGSIIIPNTVTRIRGSAFYNCSSLTTLSIPNSVATIGEEKSINYVLLGGCGVFSRCIGLTSITIPNSVSGIADCTFWGCSNLTKVTIGNSVSSIGNGTFQKCYSLASIVIPNSVTRIGDYAFGDCNSLSSITIPSNVTIIGNNAFYGCTGLASVQVEEGNPIYDSRDKCNAIIETAKNETVMCGSFSSLPSSVTSIGENSVLSSPLTIPWSVNHIGDSWSSVEFIMSLKVNEISDWIGKDRISDSRVSSSFTDENGNDVSNLVIPEGTKTIGSYVFKGASSIETVTIPNSVTSIGNGAFADCNNISAVKSYIEDLFGIPSDCFSSSVKQNATLYVPKEMRMFYKLFDGWKEFKNIVAIENSIEPVDSNDDINYGSGSGFDSNTNLNGAVISNIYYNISDDNGEYNSAEGCIVITQPMTDGAVENVAGLDINNEQLKDTFTGIIFMVQPGSGVITVNAETTGGMTLKVKVGEKPPTEIELDGKMKEKFPYSVDKASYVYIYAGGGSAGAKAMGKAASNNGELKIYGIEWSNSTDGIKEIIDERLKMNYSDVYNLNGQKVDGMPTKKGVYIKDGKKVLVK